MFIRTRTIGVPDLPERFGGMDGSDAMRRLALPGIEEGLGDRVAWEFYCVPNNLYIAEKVYGKRLTRRT